MEELLRGRRGALLTLGLYLVAAVVLTWPIAISLDQASGIRGDYFNNVWNAWWLRHSLVNLHSPWFTDFLYYPDGVELGRHTLSPLNALAGAALGTILSGHAAYNVLLICKFALAAWTFFLFARYMTGSTAGAFLAGIAYSFNPFHYYYLCQINIFTLELLPVALLFTVRTYREGSWRNTLWAAFALGAIAATTTYYVVFAYLVLGMLLLFGWLLDPSVPFRIGCKRVATLAVLGTLLVGIGAAPLIGAILRDGTGETTWASQSDPDGLAGDELVEEFRQNDLLGYTWYGPPERVRVSWPSMLGYSSLLLIALSWRALSRQRFWVLVGLTFWILGLGSHLRVAGHETAFPLPYAFLTELPLLSMLRKADRFFVLVQFVVALLCAEAWSGLARRIRHPGWRTGAWAACTALIALELSGVPFRRFQYQAPAYFEELAQNEAVESVIELPPRRWRNARYNFFQTVHGKKEVLGYCTDLALSKENDAQREMINETYLDFITGKSPELLQWIGAKGVDAIVFHRTVTDTREPDPAVHEDTVWAPFFLRRRELISPRQEGADVDRPLLDQTIGAGSFLLDRVYGAPVHEDAEVIVFLVGNIRR